MFVFKKKMIELTIMIKKLHCFYLYLMFVFKVSNGHPPQICENGELLVRMCRGESHFSQKSPLANVGKSGKSWESRLANVDECIESGKSRFANGGESVEYSPSLLANVGGSAHDRIGRF